MKRTRPRRLAATGFDAPERPVPAWWAKAQTLPVEVEPLQAVEVLAAWGIDVNDLLGQARLDRSTLAVLGDLASMLCASATAPTSSWRWYWLRSALGELDEDAFLAKWVPAAALSRARSALSSAVRGAHEQWQAQGAHELGDELVRLGLDVHVPVHDQLVVVAPARWLPALTPSLVLNGWLLLLAGPRIYLEDQCQNLVALRVCGPAAAVLGRHVVRGEHLAVAVGTVRSGVGWGDVVDLEGNAATLVQVQRRLDVLLAPVAPAGC